MGRGLEDRRGNLTIKYEKGTFSEAIYQSSSISDLDFTSGVVVDLNKIELIGDAVVYRDIYDHEQVLALRFYAIPLDKSKLRFLEDKLKFKLNQEDLKPILEREF